MRYNKYANTMEPDTIATPLEVLWSSKKRYAPKLSAPSSLLPISLKQCALDPLSSDEESLAHKEALVCYLSTETDGSAIVQL
jgi:hypothetical protein